MVSLPLVFKGVSVPVTESQTNNFRKKEEITGMQIPKGVKKACDILSTVVVILVVALAVLLVGVRLFGVQVFSVVSGSMEPDYPVGSLIYVKEVDSSTVQVGDVITFVLPDNTPATHRVIDIDEANQHFYTKGDANQVADGAPVHFKNLIGKPVFMIPLLGYVAYYIQRPPYMYVAIAVAAILLILAFVPDLLKPSDKSKKSDSKEDATKEPEKTPAEAPTEEKETTPESNGDTNQG